MDFVEDAVVDVAVLANYLFEVSLPLAVDRRSVLLPRLRHRCLRRRRRRRRRHHHAPMRPLARWRVEFGGRQSTQSQLPEG